MNTIKNYFPEFQPYHLTDGKELLKLDKLLDFSFPTDYQEFISVYNGGEGSLGEDYLALWSIADMLDTEQFYKKEDPVFFEKYWIFASNTGIFRYAFEKSTGRIVEIDPYEDEYAVFMGNTLQEFLINFANKKL